MRYSLASALLAISGVNVVSAAPASASTSASASASATSKLAAAAAPSSTVVPPALPITQFKTKEFIGLSLDDILAGVKKQTEEGVSNVFEKLAKTDDILTGLGSTNVSGELAKTITPRATCSNPRIRREWDSYSASDRVAFADAIKCLTTKTRSGQFAASQSRYEDLVALHQVLTPNVHQNDKFLLWHRYYLWTFEQLLRDECGFTRELPWFDETRYAGRFKQSSIFTAANFGSIDIGGQCVTDGKFANFAINIGPGSGNTRHCLSRNVNEDMTANTNSQMVDGCNALSTFHDMAYCAERAAHAYGHNGVGAVMQDVYASPADPVFWLHHAFIDRNYRIWQNQDGSRKTQISGTDISGRQLTLDSTVNVYGIRPDAKIRDILDTVSTTLCYKYSY